MTALLALLGGLAAIAGTACVILLVISIDKADSFDDIEQRRGESTRPGVQPDAVERSASGYTSKRSLAGCEAGARCSMSSPTPAETLRPGRAMGNNGRQIGAIERAIPDLRAERVLRAGVEHEAAPAHFAKGDLWQ